MPRDQLRLAVGAGGFAVDDVDGVAIGAEGDRGLRQRDQVLRRAAWLCLLANSNVSYREPGAATARCLVITNAELSEADAGS